MKNNDDFTVKMGKTAKREELMEQKKKKKHLLSLISDATRTLFSENFSNLIHSIADADAVECSVHVCVSRFKSSSKIKWKTFLLAERARVCVYVSSLLIEFIRAQSFCFYCFQRI